MTLYPLLPQLSISSQSTSHYQNSQFAQLLQNSWILASFSSFVHPHTFPSSSATKGTISWGFLRSRNATLVRRSTTSSIWVGIQYFTMQEISSLVIPISGSSTSLFPASMWGAIPPQVVNMWSPTTDPYFFTRSFWRVQEQSSPISLKPDVLDPESTLPLLSLFFMSLMTRSTTSSPICLQIVHLPPIKLISPLLLLSITCFLDTCLVSVRSFTSSITRGRIPVQLDLSNLNSSEGAMSSNTLFIWSQMNLFSSIVMVGLSTGSSILLSVVPAIVFPSQGTTISTLPSSEFMMIPWPPGVTLRSKVRWDPATGISLLEASGLSICLILSANAPVQFTTYFEFTLISSFESLSLKVSPVILPSESLEKLVNQAWLIMLAGAGLCGRVEVKSTDISICASLNCPSSKTIPPWY